MIGNEAIARRFFKIAFLFLIYTNAINSAFAQENLAIQAQQELGAVPQAVQSSAQTAVTTTTTTTNNSPPPGPTEVVTEPNVVTTAPVAVTTTALPPPGTALTAAPAVTSQTTVTTAQGEAPAQPTVVTQTVTRAPAAGQPAAQPMTVSEFDKWLQQHGYPRQNGNGNGNGRKQVVSGPVQPQERVVTHRARRPRGHRVIGEPLSYLENQQIMINSAPPSRVPPIPDADIAFNTMLQQNMPLSPRQVVRLRQQIDVSQRAASILPNIPPKPVSTTLMVNLAPGTTPPAIRLAQGYVSSLVFVDSTGAPWPIAAFDIGNPRAVNLQWDGKSNILILQAVTPYSNGDMVIRLVGLPTPITLELVSGQRVVDYRVDLHVPGIGPNTKELPTGTQLPGSANQLLLGVLDGVAPPGSRGLLVRGADAQAWILGDRLYLRTRFNVLSPGWIGTMVSPDGMHAYELPRTSSILISRYGTPAELRVEGF